VAGHYYLLNWMNADFGEMAQINYWHPRQFLAGLPIFLSGCNNWYSGVEKPGKE
jgi:hypothetical protein